MPETFLEIRRRAFIHINAEEAVAVRNDSSHSHPVKPGNTSKASRPLRVHETSTVRHVPYKRGEPRAGFREEEVCPKFKISYKELIVIPAVAEKLRFPSKAERNLGPKRDAWCDFHKGFGHDIERCLALGRHLAEFLNEGFLKEYCEVGQEEPHVDTSRKDPSHEIPVYGKIKTISGGFSRGGSSAIERNRYARAVMLVETQEPDDAPNPPLYFTKTDLVRVVSHENDPVVISVVTIGRRVYRVLIDQERSDDVMFWSTFVNL